MEHAMKALLHSTSLDCRLSGVELFITFASLVEHTSAIVWDQDGLVHAFVAMANEGTTDHVDGTTRLSEEARQNQRIAGLRGLRAYFNLMRESPSALMEWSKVLPTIFANVRYDAEAAAVVPNMLRDEEDEEDGDVAADTFDEDDLQLPSSWTVPALGHATLRDVASIVPTADVKSFVGHALKILDKEAAWAPDADRDFAASALRTIVVREKSQDNQAAVERVLSYLDKQKDPAVKTAVARALVVVLKDIPSLLSVHGLMRSLLKQLAKVDAAAPELQVVLAECVVAAASRAGPRQRIDALGQVNSALVDAQASVSGRGTELSQVRDLYIVQCIMPLCNSTLLEKMPRGREMVVAGLLGSLVAASGDESVVVRTASFACMAVVIAAMEPLSSAAAVARTPRAMSFDDEGDVQEAVRGRSSSRSRSSRSGLNDPNDHIWLRFDLSVKRAMYAEVLRDDPSLICLNAVLRLINASLETFGAHDLVTLVPMLFKVQEEAAASDCASAHVLVAATMQTIADWLHDESFAAVVEDVTARRAKGRQGSASVAVDASGRSVLLVVPSTGSAAPAPAPKKSRKSKKKGSAAAAAAATAGEPAVEKITVLFERSAVVDALVAVDALLAHVNAADSSEAYGSSENSSDDDGRLERERTRLREALLRSFDTSVMDSGRSDAGTDSHTASKDVTPVSGKRGGRRNKASSGTKGSGRTGSKASEGPTTPVASPRATILPLDDSESDTVSESLEEVTPRLGVSSDHAVSQALRYVARSGRASGRSSRRGDLPDFALLRRQAQSSRSMTPVIEAASADSFDALAARAEEAAATRATQFAEVTAALESGDVPDWPTLRDSLLATGTVPSSEDHPVRDGAMPRLQEEYACCDLLSQTLLQTAAA
jgi:hypothetical protein